MMQLEEHIKKAHLTGIIIFILLSPLYFFLAFKGLDNFFWCEDLWWISRVGLLQHNFFEIFKVYGRDFNPFFIAFLYAFFKVFGMNVFAINFFGILLHFLNGLLIVILFSKILKREIMAGVISLLFLISRHTDETVFWMAALPHAFSFFFGFLSWNLLEAKSKKLKILGYFSFVFSLLSKETGFVVLFLIFLKNLFFEGGKFKKRLKLAFVKARILFLIFFVYLILRLFIFTPTHLGDVYKISFALKKFSFVFFGLFEIPVYWDSFFTVLKAILFITVLFIIGDKITKFSIFWILVSLFPFLFLHKHSPRYTLFAYPGFLLLLCGIYLQLEKAFKKGVVYPAIAIFLAMLVYQSYYFSSDELDYDMRADFVKKLWEQYQIIAPQVSDGPVVIIPRSERDAQAYINYKCRVPKLNAYIKNGLWKIVVPWYVVGAVEFERGRVWVKDESIKKARPLIHRDEGFLWNPKKWIEVDKNCYNAGLLVSLRNKNEKKTFPQKKVFKK